jgi:hypothetical protein
MSFALYSPVLDEYEFRLIHNRIGYTTLTTQN